VARVAAYLIYAWALGGDWAQHLANQVLTGEGSLLIMSQNKHVQYTRVGCREKGTHDEVVAFEISAHRPRAALK
jgi:hypothetical protein